MMEGIAPFSPFEDFGYMNKVVIYVNPRQYDRILKRRVERDMFMDRRGKPRPVYVPIAVREFSMKMFPNDNYMLGFDPNKRKFGPGVQNGVGAAGSNNINIYINNPVTNNNPINNINNNVNGNCINSTNIGNGINSIMGCFNSTNGSNGMTTVNSGMSNINGSGVNGINDNMGTMNNGINSITSVNSVNGINNVNGMGCNSTMYSNMFNCNMFSAGYGGVMNKGLEGGNGLASMRNPKLEDYSLARGTKPSQFTQGTGSNYYGGYYGYNGGYYGKESELDKDFVGKFDTYAQNDMFAGYDSFVPNMFSSQQGLANPYNLNNPGSINSLYITNNLAGNGSSANPYGTHSSVSTNSSTDRDGKDTDSTSTGSINSREEIKNNYLHLTNSPYSESCSIDYEVVAKPEQIYNIDQQGIVIDVDADTDLSCGLSNSSIGSGLMSSIDGPIIDNVQDFNYIANRDFYQMNPEEDFEKATTETAVPEKNSIDSCDSLSTDQYVPVNPRKSRGSGRTGRSRRKGGDHGASGERSRDKRRRKDDFKQGSSIYRELYNCFSDESR